MSHTDATGGAKLLNVLDLNNKTTHQQPKPESLLLNVVQFVGSVFLLLYPHRCKRAAAVSSELQLQCVSSVLLHSGFALFMLSGHIMKITPSAITTEPPH